MTVGWKARPTGPLDPGDDALWISCVARAARTTDPVRAIGSLLRYLEAFPLGAHNREVAESIEDQLDHLSEGRAKVELLGRFRSLRDAYMPPIRAVPLPIALGDRPSWVPGEP